VGNLELFSSKPGEEAPRLQAGEEWPAYLAINITGHLI
jgi:hypothetical protein